MVARSSSSSAAAAAAMLGPSLAVMTHAMGAFVLSLLLRDVTSTEMFQQQPTPAAIHRFVVRAHMLQALLFMHVLAPQSHRWMARRRWLYQLFRLYATHVVTWLFLLQAFHVSSGDAKSLVEHVHVTGILALATMRATETRLTPHIFRLPRVPLVLASLPRASFTCVVIALSSAAYLLDWRSPWQTWPVPTVVGAFLAGALQDLVPVAVMSS